MRCAMFLKKLFQTKKRNIAADDFDPAQYPSRLNLGCGLDKRPDYLNVDLNDFHKPDLVCDVSKLACLATGFYRHILAYDILEHIERPKIPNTLKEWNRVLQPGGTLDFQVPSATGLLTVMAKPENRSYEMHNRLLQCLFGTQTYDGDYHHFAFTDIVLNKLFEESGFDIVRLETVHEWLFRGFCKKTRDEHVEPFYFFSDDQFLHELYRTLLNRDADPEGLQFYLAMLKHGISREAIAEAIKNSDEYKQFSGSKLSTGR
jgi:predicted SAM-dependent methyltransferase